MKYYECEDGTLYVGDILDNMSKLPDKSVNCVITSPPYWQLRDYGFPEQWGLEPTFQEYLEHMRLFMAECWRVLKDDGTVWVNLGDTYGGSSCGTSYDTACVGKTGIQTNVDKWPGKGHCRGGKDKCLLLIPHRFAINCIDDGWILRNDIIWAKRNGMPESVRDRFSKKHEYIFLLVKNKKYYFDLDGVRDKTIDPANGRCFGNNQSSGKSVRGEWNPKNPMIGKNPGDVSDFWDIVTRPSSSKHYATYNTELIDKPIIAGCPEGGVILDPFCGTGTTLIRAEQLNRKWIGIDGSDEYCEIAKDTMENETLQLRIDI